MHPVIAKTFGGLSLQYYFRHFIFGSVLSAFVIFMSLHGKQGVYFSNIFFAVICAFLYPYSRFVYESIVGFIIGENVFFINAGLMLAVKLITIVACWSFSIFIAPIGLAYLYFYHSKENTET